METEKSSLQHLEKVTCKIDMKLPSLNDYINACRSNKFKAATMKKDYEDKIGLFIMNLPKFKHPVRMHFIWVEDNKRRDLDNVAFGKKFILDSLVKFGKLKNDNRRNVIGFTDSFKYKKEACVILIIREVPNNKQTKC